MLVAAARSGAALVSRQAHATVANRFFGVLFKGQLGLIYYDESAIMILSR